MNLTGAVQVSIDTAVQPCKDRKVRGMAIVGDWGGHAMSLVGHSWVVVHIVYDGQLLVMSG